MTGKFKFRKRYEDELKQEDEKSNSEFEINIKRPKKSSSLSIVSSLISISSRNSNRNITQMSKIIKWITFGGTSKEDIVTSVNQLH